VRDTDRLGPSSRRAALLRIDVGRAGVGVSNPCLSDPRPIEAALCQWRFHPPSGGESSNGRTADSDSACLGSNPSSPANRHSRSKFSDDLTGFWSSRAFAHSRLPSFAQRATVSLGNFINWPFASTPMNLILVAVFALTLSMFAQADPARANHATPGAFCGMSSGNTARTCSPSSLVGCKRAAARGVHGVTIQGCAKRAATCSSCLAGLQRCVARLSHQAPRMKTCATCSARLSKCLDKT
jgi:hypothetical protein